MDNPINKSTKIKDWSEEDRPREKLIEKGRRALTNAELIAILINSGSREETAVELSRKILSSVNNDLNMLGKMNVAELKRFKGIGEAKAISIVAALELGRRRESSDIREQTHLKTPKDFFELFRPIIGDLPHEELWLVCLNGAFKVLHKERISIGGLSATIADNRLILKTALDVFAQHIVIVHNHPSGRLMASTEDIKMTKKLKKAAELLEIKLSDHLIVTDTDFLSFAEKGLM